MTGISTLHAASLLRRHDLKLDSYGAMGTLGNLKFAAAGGTAPSRRARFFDKIVIRLGALKDVLCSSSQQRANMRAWGEALRAEKRCAHLFGKLTANMMGNRAAVASVDKTLRRMTDMMSDQDVDGKWRRPLQGALNKVNAQDRQAMREGLLDLDRTYPDAVGPQPDNVSALVRLLKGMLEPVTPSGTGSVSTQRSKVITVEEGTQPNQPQVLVPSPPSPPPPPPVEEGTQPNQPQVLVPSPPSPPPPPPVEEGTQPNQPQVLVPSPPSPPPPPPVEEGTQPNQPQVLVPSPPPPPPPPPPPTLSKPEPKSLPGPDEASNERSHNDALADAIRNPQLRKVIPSPNPVGAKHSHQDELLNAIRNPQLRSREQADEAFKKTSDKDKAKVDAAKDKALTSEQRKFGGLHGGLMDEIKGAEGLSPSQLKGRVKKT